MNERLELKKGNAYFIALNEGEVYQAEYRGFHGESGCYWFAPLPYVCSANGPQWVFFRRVRCIFDLGTPSNSAQFQSAVERVLE